MVARRGERLSFQRIKKSLGLPLFVKPANLGSSVGVSKVHTEREFTKSVADAFAYDSKIIIEEAIVGDELFVSVLGNENPTASVPGKLITDHMLEPISSEFMKAHEVDRNILKGKQNNRPEAQLPFKNMFYEQGSLF